MTLTHHHKAKHMDNAPYIEPLPDEKRLINRRLIWAANRFWMEVDNMKTKRYGNKRPHRWYELLLLMKSFKIMTHVLGIYEKGVRHAEDIQLNEKHLYFSNLPDAFEGFTLLHLSDLHLDGMEGLEDRILRIIDGREVDLCVLTGDYRTELHGLHRHIIKGMKYLIDGINSRQGFVGILGNHDGCHMVNPLEKIGIHMLINSSCDIHKNTDTIKLIGTDDVHYYYTDQAMHAFEHANEKFSIALVHSPELYDIAAQMGIDLYLCGHTHAGQVCLPGGFAVIRHLNRGRRFYRGCWQYKNMQGVTHSGVGTSGIPVRYNSRGEVLILHLHGKKTAHFEENRLD